MSSQKNILGQKKVVKKKKQKNRKKDKKKNKFEKCPANCTVPRKKKKEYVIVQIECCLFCG